MIAKKPVSVGGVEFDALISETRTFSATVPQYSVESGAQVSDDIILDAEQLEMTLFLTNTPVTWASHAAQGRIESVIQQLEELYYAKSPVTVVTTEKTFTNMAIESMTISKTAEIGYAREIPITFKQIRTTVAKKTSIPESYGRSGTTAASAGTASTSNKSSSSSGSSSSKSRSGSSSSSSSSSKSSSSSSGSKSSILYGAAKSFGLI